MKTKDKFILVIIFIIAITVSSSTNCQGQIKFYDKEFFTISLSADPTSSIKQKGLDIVGEIEYAGKVYVKVGFESFSVLYGGYEDFHGAIGLNLNSGNFEEFRYYLGVRTAYVFRDSGYALNYGLESGIDYDLSKNLFIGLRATVDKRNEQKVIFGWNPETKISGFIRIGYKWDFKNR